jgi:hypothetical protein
VAGRAPSAAGPERDPAGENNLWGLHARAGTSQYRDNAMTGRAGVRMDMDAALRKQAPRRGEGLKDRS